MESYIYINQQNLTIMKTSDDLGSSHKKRSSYFFIAFFVIAIFSMAIVAWKLGVFE